MGGNENSSYKWTPLTNDPHRSQHCSEATHQITISLFWNIWNSSKTLWLSKTRVSWLLTQKESGYCIHSKLSDTFRPSGPSKINPSPTTHFRKATHTRQVIIKVPRGKLGDILVSWACDSLVSTAITLLLWKIGRRPPFQMHIGLLPPVHVVIIARQLSWHTPSPLARLPWESSFPWIGDELRNFDLNCNLLHIC